jgi:putative FmdB family regulatory protein
MPTYEYECTKCGHTLEVFQRITDNPLAECPKCKGRLRRVIHGGMGVVFKGSGFYTTDYKRGSASTGGGNGSSPKKEKEAEKPKADKTEKPVKSEKAASE